MFKFFLSGEENSIFFIYYEILQFQQLLKYGESLFKLLLALDEEEIISIFLIPLVINKV